MELSKRSLLAGGLLAVGAAGAARADIPGGYEGEFVTRHEGIFDGKAMRYTARVAPTLIPAHDGRPALSLVTTAYTAHGANPARRPVLFAFNGGPSSSSSALHMMALGPKRIVLGQDPAAPPLAPQVVDNGYSVLNAADLVLVDPAETGFSRTAGGGRRDAFYSAEGDAQSVSDFVVAWSRANGRAASPKYVLGESYGTIRAALMAGQLAETMPLDGVFLFGQAVNMIETSQRARNAISYAANITALATIAAYHGRGELTNRTPAEITDIAYRFGMGEYLQALVRGHDLPQAEQQAMAQRLQAMTGIPAAYYRAHDLQITKIAFARELLKDKGLILGTYDGRYTGPAPAAGARAADPAAQLTAGLEAAMLDHYARDLGVTWPASAYRSAAPGADAWDWSANPGPGGPFLDYDYTARLSKAFRAKPTFRLVVGAGYYDLTTTIGPARYLVTKSDWPRDRVFQRQYVGGHMSYTNLPSLKTFVDDIRGWVRGGAPGGRPPHA